jgi:Pectate lyase superfamily protein
MLMQRTLHAKFRKQVRRGPEDDTRRHLPFIRVSVLIVAVLPCMFVQRGAAAETNVVSMGADPTGVKDSRAAIQRAIDAASAAGGGIVTFPSGTYLLDSYQKGSHPWVFYNLLVPSNVTLAGSPETLLLQGSGGRAPLPTGARRVTNVVVAIGTRFFATVRFQNSSYNGGFQPLNPTQVNDSTVTLAASSGTAQFRAGDYVAIYEKTVGDVLPSELSQLTSVNQSTGELGLAFPLARGFQTPSIAKVTQLATSHVSLRNLTIQGTVPMTIMETFDFTASNCHFIYDGTLGGLNSVTPMVVNSVRGLRIVDSSFEPVGSVYAGVELPQRNSQDVAFENVTFKVKGAGFGEYAAHWMLTNNHFWLFPDSTQTVGITLGGLDVTFSNNDVHGENIIAGNGQGSLIRDATAGSASYWTYVGGIRIKNNAIECVATGSYCVSIVVRDTLVSGNQIKTTGTSAGILVESSLPQTVHIEDNSLSMQGGGNGIHLVTTSPDGCVIRNNTITGTGKAGVDVASGPTANSGGHTISNNTITGFLAAVSIDMNKHPGTTVSANH